MKPGTTFVELDKSLHDRKGFRCGEDELNLFLQQYAVRHASIGISKTMVLTADEDDSQICSFYTLSHTEIKREFLPQTQSKKLPRYPVPVLLIAQLAVHSDCQGMGLGEDTLVRALKHCYQINRQLPSYAVVVDCLTDQVQAFYEQYGFIVLDDPGERQRMFLPMGTISQLL